MTDKEFARISPLLAAQPRRGRKRRTDLPSVIDAIFYVLQSGCAWANLPKDFPPKSTVYGYFRRFLEDGTWARIHDALYVETRDLEGREPQPSAAIIDSQSVKTGPNAKGDVGYDAGKKVKGRKRHILVDTLGLLLRPDVHSAGIQDRDGALRLFERLTARFAFLEVFFADGAYAGETVQQAAPRPVEIVRRCDKATGVSGAAKALDRRAHPRLDHGKPAHGEGLRALRRNRQSLHPDRHDQAHDTTPGAIR